jgi:hypothetical protein
MGNISHTGTMNGSIVLSGNYATLFALITSDQADAANVEAPAHGLPDAATSRSGRRNPRAPRLSWATAVPALTPARR